MNNNEKIFNSRLQQKHDIEANWIKATNFKPKSGEIIVYDAEIENITQLPQNIDGTNLRNYWITYPRVKIGNGQDLVNDLPFLPNQKEIIEIVYKNTYKANPDNLAEVIANASPNSILLLTAGEYQQINLIGKDSYPENLTIVGGEGVTIDGISITSGIENNGLTFVSDISNTILPKGLTFIDITMSNSFSLRNASIDGLSLIGCHITNGGINITPNKYKDTYGKDGTASTETRFSFQGTTVKNILIKDCTIDNATKDNTISKSAIYIQSGENIGIHNNTINYAEYNGIQITSVDANRRIYGDIRICGNKIVKTGNASIRVNDLENAHLYVVKNTLTDCGLSEANSNYRIYVSNLTNSTYAFKRRSEDGHNTYNGAEMEIDNGITVLSAKSYITNDQIDIDNLQLRTAFYEATPTTLANVIATAQSNATIQLASGDYGLLSLIGNTSYPENLTLTGSEGTNIAGVIITSGQHNGDIYRNSDISGAIMPRGLTFKGIIFTDKFNAHNCAMEDLTIDSCTFNENTHLWLNATTMLDEYGNNYGSVVTEGASTISTRPSYCATRFKNVIVKNCTFNTAYDTAIYASSVDGMTVQGNIINGAESNAVQITGIYGNVSRYSTGDIFIVGNESYDTGSRSIRLSMMDEANIYVGHNKLREANLSETNNEYIKLNYCTNSTAQWVNNIYYKWVDNVGYQGVTISVDNGIVSDIDKTELQSHIEDTDNPHNVTAEQVGAAPAGYGLGGDMQVFKFSELDTLRTTGWYFLNEMGSQVGGVWVNFAFCRVMGYGDNYIQEVFPIQSTTKVMRFGYVDSDGNTSWGDWVAKDWNNIMTSTKTSGDWFVVENNCYYEFWGTFYGTYTDSEPELILALPFSVPPENAHVQITPKSISPDQKITGYYINGDWESPSYLAITFGEDLPQDTTNGATVSVYVMCKF